MPPVRYKTRRAYVVDMSSKISLGKSSVGLVGSSPSSGTIETDKLYGLEDDSLSDDEIGVLEADNFIIYGKASIEQYDRDSPSQKIRMSAIEEALPQFFANGGMISRRHKDVKVGEALKEHKLDESTTVELEDDTLTFEAGDTLKTEVRGDTLWLVADIYSERTSQMGSMLSDATRLGAYHGELDGFSVTVFTREYEKTQQGEDVGEVDFFSVTVGEDELIKNRGSEFGVAAFKMFGKNDLKQQTKQFMSNRVFNHLFGKSRENLANETIRVAHKEEIPLDEAASEVADDGADDVADEADQKLAGYKEQLEDIEEKEMDRRELAAQVADEVGMSTEEVVELFDQMQEAESDDGGADGKGEYEEEEEEEPEADSKSEEPSSEPGLTDEQAEEVESLVEKQFESANFVSEETVNEKFEDLSEKMEDTLDDVSAEVADEISSKMETGETSDPDGGNSTEETDVETEMNNLVEQFEV